MEYKDYTQDGERGSIHNKVKMNKYRHTPIFTKDNLFQRLSILAETLQDCWRFLRMCRLLVSVGLALGEAENRYN